MNPYEGRVLAIPEGLPLTTPRFCLPPAMRPFRPVLKLFRQIPDEIGEYIVFNQIFHHDGDGEFSQGSTSCFPIGLAVPEGAFEPFGYRGGSSTALDYALEAYVNLLINYHYHLSICAYRGDPYGFLDLPPDRLAVADHQLTLNC